MPVTASDDDSRDSALVLFSGGQDSATCVAWALDRFARVETIGFDYGQRHVVELACRGAFLDALRERYPNGRAGWVPIMYWTSGWSKP